MFQSRYCNLTFTHIYSSETYTDERGRSIPPGGLEETILFFTIEFYRENHFLSHLNISSLKGLEDDFMTQNRWTFSILYYSFLRQVKNSCFNSLFLTNYFLNHTVSFYLCWVFEIPIRGNDYITLLKTKFFHFLVPLRARQKEFKFPRPVS